MTFITKNNKDTQVYIKEGKRRHGEKVMKTLLIKYSQFNDKHIFDPQRTDSLNYEEKQHALCLIIVLQEKRCGTLKARICSDDRKQ